MSHLDRMLQAYFDLVEHGVIREFFCGCWVVTGTRGYAVVRPCGMLKAALEIETMSPKFTDQHLEIQVQPSDLISFPTGYEEDE